MLTAFTAEHQLLRDRNPQQNNTGIIEKLRSKIQRPVHAWRLELRRLRRQALCMQGLTCTLDRTITVMQTTCIVIFPLKSFGYTYNIEREGEREKVLSTTN